MSKRSIWRRLRNTLARSRRIATVDVSAEGFVRTFRKRERRMRWSDVTRIDAGMRDFISYDALYVVMFAGATKIELDELDDGFRQFEYALFERWPQIREPWNRLLAAPHHVPQLETLWRRDERA